VQTYIYGQYGFSAISCGENKLGLKLSLKNCLHAWYTGSKATDEKATSSLFVSCLLVGEKVAFLSAQKATMKIFSFGHATGWICLKMLF